MDDGLKVQAEREERIGRGEYIPQIANLATCRGAALCRTSLGVL
jgi:hypothetical protein